MRKNDVGKPQFKRLLVLLAALLAATFSGCAPRPTPPAVASAGGWLGQATYLFARWKEGPSFMIWHDVLGSVGGKDSGSTSDPIYRYHGWAQSPDGRRFDWEVHTADGKAARFKIDDTSYDLADGELFIVTTRNGKTKVRQLDRDLSGVQPAPESIVAFAESDPDIARFAGVTLEVQKARHGRQLQSDPDIARLADVTPNPP